MRIDRFLTRKLSCRKQQARDWISAGHVKLDHAVVTEHTQQIHPFTHIECNGQVLQAKQARYLMLHKPAGVVSATRDAQHKTVLDLIDEPFSSELHIAGRLDATTTGLILLTNDGRWSKHLTLASSKVSKVYWVEAERAIDAKTVQAFAEGMYFATEDITTLPAKLEMLTSHTGRLTLHEGRYHQIRRMFARMGNRVVRLHREQIGQLTLGDLAEGEYRIIQSSDIG